MDTHTPIENLELKALEQRNRLHHGANELRAKIKEGRDKLRFSKHARQHFVAASIIASIAGLGVGYGLGGLVASK
jgi:hypothetical protein